MEMRLFFFKKDKEKSLGCLKEEINKLTHLNGLINAILKEGDINDIYDGKIRKNIMRLKDFTFIIPSDYDDIRSYILEIWDLYKKRLFSNINELHGQLKILEKKIDKTIEENYNKLEEYKKIV